MTEFTINDFRTISFLIETGDDHKLYNFLTNNLTHISSVNKWSELLKTRMDTISETITFTINGKNVIVNLKIWKDNFQNNFKDIKKVLNIDDFILTLDYPKEFLHDTLEELMVDCVYNIVYKGKEIDFSLLTKDEQFKVFERLPSTVSNGVLQFIEQNDHPIVLMPERLGMSEISVNFFNNTSFDLIKTLYSYYNYENILETLFMLSRRIQDIQYLNSRNPRDLDFLIKLYGEEVAKSEPDTKSII